MGVPPSVAVHNPFQLSCVGAQTVLFLKLSESVAVPDVTNVYRVGAELCPSRINSVLEMGIMRGAVPFVVALVELLV